MADDKKTTAKKTAGKAAAARTKDAPVKKAPAAAKAPVKSKAAAKPKAVARPVTRAAAPRPKARAEAPKRAPREKIESRPLPTAPAGFAPVVAANGDPFGSVELPESLAKSKRRTGVLFQAFQAARANARLGTAATKNRARVSGGGAKPWRQKGTAAPDRVRPARRTGATVGSCSAPTAAPTGSGSPSACARRRSARPSRPARRKVG